MTIEDPIEMLVLEEFRLSTSEAQGAVARIVCGSRRGREPAVPLLTSTADPRNVALLRGLHAGEPAEPDVAQHAALAAFVSSWQAIKRYGPRITERSQSPPTHYRLAVTESGINDPNPVTDVPRDLPENATGSGVGLLWIGQPLGTFAGLMVLLGTDEDPMTAKAEGSDWPLPLSSYLGVRIYESRG